MYERFCGGTERKVTPAQERAYFDALSRFSSGVVAEAVKRACSRTWPPMRPQAGDLVELCAVVLKERAVPGSVCDVCQGDKFTYTHCEGWTAKNGEAMPVNRQALCRRDFPHSAHDEAHPCYQCHPAARREDDAA